MSDRAHLYGQLLIGGVFLAGLKACRDQLRSWAQTITTPRTVYVTEPEPVTERTLCISCGRLCRRQVMAWDGFDFICDDCARRDAV